MIRYLRNPGVITVKVDGWVERDEGARHLPTIVVLQYLQYIRTTLPRPPQEEAVGKGQGIDASG